MNSFTRFLILITIFAMVYSNIAEARSLNLIKKGIVLKCQGNPVSCYGKRSLADDLNLEQEDSLESQSVDSLSEEKVEEAFEKILGKIIRSCKNGNTKACNTMLNMMNDY